MSKSHQELVKKATTLTPEQASNPANPKVFFDISIGSEDAGRVTFEVKV